MDANGATTQRRPLVQLLREQSELYSRLRELSERQRNLISGDHPELLLDILRDRQTLVMSLARINEALSPYRRDWEAVYSGLDTETRAEVADLLRDINGTLQIILRTDQEDGALLAARKQAVGRAIESVNDARSANAAYARGAYHRPTGGADMRG
ncbi:MAG: flagellar export chaperone FlgN [Planctomycetes bacterium]|nr:flagellar export chaperone FlgN [Planctomycetota bacterium]